MNKTVMNENKKTAKKVATKEIDMSQAVKGEQYKVQDKILIFKDAYLSIASGVHYEFKDQETKEIFDFSEYDKIKIQEL